MPTWGWLVIAAVVIVVIAVIAWSAARRRRTDRLRGRFGPEYERAVEDRGSRRQAESELEARQRRREELQIRPLQPAARQRYIGLWSTAQSRFVDAPADAVREADALVAQVMGERGYPMDDFEQRAADVSVDHPVVVENYRAAHRISLANDRGEASTEDLRQAFVHYRTLFEDLLETGEGGDGYVAAR